MALRRNILLFHQGALGDFIVTWPLAMGLARVFAQSRVFYVTGGQKGALAEKALRVESVDVEGGWHQLYSQEPKLPEPAAKLLAGAQQIISFVSGPVDLWVQNVRKMAPEAGLITLSTVPPFGFEGHITDFLCQQLQPAPVIRAAMSQMLQSVASRGLGYPPVVASAPVVLHPGAGSGKKCWPAESFLALAEKLKSEGRAVSVILGEVELERWPREQIAAFQSAAHVHQPGSLVELMKIISGASLFVGNDSGPGHLAGILGIPTISIFGPKSPDRWKPLGPRVRTVSAEWEQINADRVVEEISRGGGA